MCTKGKGLPAELYLVIRAGRVPHMDGRDVALEPVGSHWSCTNMHKRYAIKTWTLYLILGGGTCS